jgi:Putative transmembrane protein (PGPGW)
MAQGVEWLQRTWPNLIGFLLSPMTLVGLTLFSVVTCVASLAGTSWAVRRLPVDYLLGVPERAHHPGRSGVTLLLRNALGVVLLLLGALLLVLPGQGLLTILAAISLMDFRGKRRLERRLMLQPRVFALINRFRIRAGVPRLLAPAPTRTEDEPT